MKMMPQNLQIGNETREFKAQELCFLPWILHENQPVKEHNKKLPTADKPTGMHRLFFLSYFAFFYQIAKNMIKDTF